MTLSISRHVSRPPLRLHSVSWKPPFQPLTLARARGVKNPQNRGRQGTKANVITTSANHSSHKFLKWSISHSVMSNFLRPHGLQPTRLPYPQSSPSKKPGGGCRFLLQGIFPTQRSNLGLPHCRQFRYIWATREWAPGDMLINGASVTTVKLFRGILLWESRF